MKRILLLFFFSVVAPMIAPVLASADELLLTFTGYDYEDANPTPGTFLAVGDGYKVVGFVTSVGPLLTPYTDFSTEEYTFTINGLVVATRQTFGNLLAVTMNNGGRGRYYFDDLAPPNGTGTHGDYGINPPNGTSPSTFADGSLGLGGSIDNFTLTYNYSVNQGTFQGNMTLDEGPYLSYIPPAQRSGWVLAGLAGPPNPSVPTGYVNQLSGECRIPDATTTTRGTWGAVKALYR
jgi:hypothetical protein